MESAGGGGGMMAMGGEQGGAMALGGGAGSGGALAEPLGGPGVAPPAEPPLAATPEELAGWLEAHLTPSELAELQASFAMGTPDAQAVALVLSQ